MKSEKQDLKKLIRDKYDSQIAFSVAVKEHDSLVSQVVNGWKQVPKSRQATWAKALGCKVKDIF